MPSPTRGVQGNGARSTKCHGELTEKRVMGNRQATNLDGLIANYGPTPEGRAAIIKSSTAVSGSCA